MDVERSAKRKFAARRVRGAERARSEDGAVRRVRAQGTSACREVAAYKSAPSLRVRGGSCAPRLRMPGRVARFGSTDRRDACARCGGAGAVAQGAREGAHRVLPPLCHRLRQQEGRHRPRADQADGPVQPRPSPPTPSRPHPPAPARLPLRTHPPLPAPPLRTCRSQPGRIPCAGGSARPLSQTPGEVNGTQERATYMINIAEECLKDIEIEPKQGQPPLSFRPHAVHDVVRRCLD